MPARHAWNALALAQGIRGLTRHRALRESAMKPVFIHISKNAGTAIQRLFHRIGDMVWGPESWLGRERIDGRWYDYQHLSLQDLALFLERFQLRADNIRCPQIRDSGAYYSHDQLQRVHQIYARDFELIAGATGGRAAPGL